MTGATRDEKRTPKGVFYLARGLPVEAVSDITPTTDMLSPQVFWETQLFTSQLPRSPEQQSTRKPVWALPNPTQLGVGESERREFFWDEWTRFARMWYRDKS